MILDDLESVLAILTIELNCSVCCYAIRCEECNNVACASIHKIRIDNLLELSCADAGDGKEPFGFLIQHLKRKISKCIIHALCGLWADAFNLSRAKISYDAFLGWNDYLIVVFNLKLNAVFSTFAPTTLNIVSEFVRQRQTIANCLYLRNEFACAIVDLFAGVVNRHHIGSGIGKLYALWVYEPLEFT